MNGIFIKLHCVKSEHGAWWFTVLSIQYCAGMQDTTRDGWRQELLFFFFFFFSFLRNSYLQQRENMNTWQFIYRIAPTGFWLNWSGLIKWKENTTWNKQEKERREKFIVATIWTDCWFDMQPHLIFAMHRELNAQDPTCWSEPYICRTMIRKVF